MTIWDAVAMTSPDSGGTQGASPIWSCQVQTGSYRESSFNPLDFKTGRNPWPFLPSVPGANTVLGGDTSLAAQTSEAAD